MTREQSAAQAWDKLIAAASAASRRAYAPYSGYSVGAALRTVDGRVVVGCNVENASYSLSCCAERTAVFTAIANGDRDFDAIAIVTRDGGTPCGACRQVLAEFAPVDHRPFTVLLANLEGVLLLETTLADLLPSPFAVPQ